MEHQNGRRFIVRNTNMADVKSCEEALFLSEAAEYCRKVNVVYIWLSQEFKRIVISLA